MSTTTFAPSGAAMRPHARSGPQKPRLLSALGPATLAVALSLTLTLTLLTGSCANGAPPSEGEAGGGRAGGARDPARPSVETGSRGSTSGTRSPADTTPSQSVDAAYADLRRRMVKRQIQERGVEDPAVLRAMRAVPRHRFVPEAAPVRAYGDTPYPIEHGQTISQPYIVAFMADAADIESGDRVLEIGTGSGYGAAVLAELASEVYTIEIIPELARRARDVLDELGYENVHVRTGNGWLGWPEHAPYDAIVVTAAPDEVPQALVEQLGVGGTLVVPVGELRQSLRIIEKTEDGLEEQSVLPVRFVPMVEEPADTTG